MTAGEEESVELMELTPEVRAHYVGIGERFGPQAVLEQSAVTLRGLEAHGATLARFGFIEEDAQGLRDGQAALREALQDRGEAQGQGVASTQAWRQATRGGKNARRRARTVLAISQRRLARARTPDADVVSARIDEVLATTQRSGADDALLRSQLATLRDALGDPMIAAITDGRGGVEARGEVEAALEAFTAAEAGRGTGTQTRTERINVLEGMIVEYVRDARLAAREAASALGQSALVEPFELGVLYGE